MSTRPIGNEPSPPIFPQEEGKETDLKADDVVAVAQEALDSAYEYEPTDLTEDRITSVTSQMTPPQLRRVQSTPHYKVPVSSLKKENKTKKDKKVRWDDEEQSLDPKLSLNRAHSERRLSWQEKEEELASKPSPSPLPLSLSLTLPKESTVSTEDLKKELPYFLTMESTIYFAEEKGARELSSCLRKFPHAEDKILEIVHEMQKSIKNPRHTHRMPDLLVSLLQDPKNAHFLVSYFMKNTLEIDGFVAIAFPKLMKKKPHADLIQLFTQLTKEDLKSEKAETLFRISTLSSSLCNAYGYHLWRGEVYVLTQSVAKQLKKTEFSNHSFDRETVKKMLFNEFARFKELNEEGQVFHINKELQNHVKNFVRLIDPIFNDIYALKISPEFSELLQMRRSLIMDFLKNQRLDSTKKTFEVDEVTLEEFGDKIFELSRTHIASLLFHHILIPHLLEINCEPEKRRVLLNLTKMIDYLSKEGPLANEKADPLYEMLEPFCGSHLKIHRQFLDLHTEPRKRVW